MNKLASLRHYGAKCTNHVWSWSARTAAGEVLLFLWQNLIGGNGRGGWTYADVEENLEADKLGCVERLEDLRYARDHHGGLFRVIVVEPVDPRVRPLNSKADGYTPRPDKIMRIIDLNEETGALRAEEVGGLGRLLRRRGRA